MSAIGWMIATVLCISLGRAALAVRKQMQRRSEWRADALKRARELQRMLDRDPAACVICGSDRALGTEYCSDHFRHPPRH